MVYVSFSGGADSTALAIMLKEAGEEIELVFADTGAELPETYALVPKVAHELGVKLHVVPSPGMFSLLVQQGFFLPSSLARWCTRLLKQKPLNAWLESRAPCTIAIGIRGDEAHRARRPLGARPDVEYIWPLAESDLTKEDVQSLCRKRGLLNMCYEWRSSCSCFCCPFQRKRDWLNLYRRHPDLYMLAEVWEEQSKLRSPESNFCWTGSYSLQELREADEVQLSLFRETREQPCTLCVT